MYKKRREGTQERKVKYPLWKGRKRKILS